MRDVLHGKRREELIQFGADKRHDVVRYRTGWSLHTMASSTKKFQWSVGVCAIPTELSARIDSPCVSLVGMGNLKPDDLTGENTSSEICDPHFNGLFERIKCLRYPNLSCPHPQSFAICVRVSFPPHFLPGPGYVSWCWEAHVLSARVVVATSPDSFH